MTEASESTFSADSEAPTVSDERETGCCEPSGDVQPWEPAPLSEDAFLADEGWTNINRSPYDRISGVLYKRAMAIKSVRSVPLDAAPDMPEPWSGHGETVVRWLFSEEPDTEEGLLPHREFRALQTLSLAPQASTGQRRHPGRDTILCVVAGRGVLSHRPSSGAPVIQRPLREGDTVLISGDELYSIVNDDAENALRLFALHLGSSKDVDMGSQDG